MSDKAEQSIKPGFWEFAHKHPGYTILGVFFACGAIGNLATDKPLLNFSIGTKSTNTIDLPDCSKKNV